MHVFFAIGSRRVCALVLARYEDFWEFVERPEIRGERLLSEAFKVLKSSRSLGPGVCIPSQLSGEMLEK
jgi:hypothetical protein